MGTLVHGNFGRGDRDTVVQEEIMVACSFEWLLHEGVLNLTVFSDNVEGVVWTKVSKLALSYVEGSVGSLPSVSRTLKLDVVGINRKKREGQVTLLFLKAQLKEGESSPCVVTKRSAEAVIFTSRRIRRRK